MSERTVAVNGVELHVVEEGSGPPVILAHGFPELAYSWRHQIPFLADAGYRVLALISADTAGPPDRMRSATTTSTT